jgi:NAD(P)-dependent dehydrogenase (short-subunit alcohol dehydrogenase family)
MLLITGASRGIGRYLAESYAQRGEHVVGTYHAHRVEVPGVDMVALDVRSHQAADELVRTHGQEWTDVTLICCAGVTYNAFTHKSDPEQWANVVNTNLLGTFHAMRAVLPLMRTQRKGRLILLSSVVAQRLTPGTGAYAATKAALWGLCRSVAAENVSLGITCNVLNLGYSELGMITDVPEAFLAQIKETIPMHALCPASDILSAVDFLRVNSYITGSSIDVNGGLI